MAYKARRLFKPKMGIDSKSAETMRGDDYLSYADNIVYSDQGELCKRPGTQLRVYGIDAYSGMTFFETTDYKGVSKQEIVFVGANAGKGPVRVIKRYLNIANATGTTVTAVCAYNPTTAVFELRLTGGLIGTVNLGTGLVGGDLTIAGLIALSGAGITYSSASVVGTVPAAFMENKTEYILTGTSADFAYYSTEEIPYGGYATAPSFTPSFPRSNPTTALINGSLYWYGSHSGTQTPLMKYDGQVWYGAGLPRSAEALQATAPTLTGSTILDCKGSHVLSQGAAWDLTDLTKIWVRYFYKDKCGSEHTGDFGIEFRPGSAGSAVASGGAGMFVPYPANIDKEKNLQFQNARGAKVDGQQGPTLAITVSAGHTIKIGDVVYFFHATTLGTGAGYFTEREVTNIGATSITISTTGILSHDLGGPVNVNNDAIISSNFRVQYFSSTSEAVVGVSGSRIVQGDLIADVPFNSIDVTYAARAAHPDIYAATAGSTRVMYLLDRSETYLFEGSTSYVPPSGKYVAGTQNGSNVLISGNIESDNTIYSASPTDVEAFYLGRNAFTVDGTVTGLGSSGATTFVSTSKQTYAVQGDIPNLNFRVEKITENLGVIAPASVVEVDEGAIHFNTIKGPFLLLGGRELKPVGEWPLDKRLSVIEPYFTYPYTPRNALIYQPSFEVSSAYVIKEKKWIVLNVPWNASSTFSYLYTGTFIYDYSMGGWFTWSGIDSTCGAVYWDDKVWLAGQGAGGTINLASMQDPTVATGYHDHGTPIAAMVRYHWENGGDINSYKKFLWLTIYSPPGNGLNYTYNVKTYVNYETASSNSWKVPTAQHTSYTVTATPPAYTVEAKLKSGKFSSLMVEISNSTTQEGMWISGTELDLAPTYRTPSRPGRSDR